MTITADAVTLTGTGQEDPRAPMVRLAQLFDAAPVPLHPADTSGVLAAHGTVDGQKVVAYCTDATTMGGAIGQDGCRHIVDAIDCGIRERWPVVGLWHSGGAKLGDGVEAMHGIGTMFSAMVRASGRVPQISVALGPAAGGAAYGAALTDLLVMAPAGRVFVTGPDVVRKVTGEMIDMEGLGGAAAHGRSGVVHVMADSEADAYVRTRRLCSLFARPGRFELAQPWDGMDPGQLLPDRPRRAYDMRPLIRAILDPADGGFEELQPRWAPNIVIGLGRLAGRTVGVVANNPIRKGGCLDTLSAEKAARFVRLCDSFGIALVVIADVPGYLPGVGQERDGVVRRGAKLLYAFAEAVVPRVTLITRKAYGGAYIAMNSRALGATRVFAWPQAEVAVMGAEAAVGVLHRKALAAAPDAEREALRACLVAEHERTAGSVDRALELGVVDEILAPAQSRRRLAEALATAPAGRGHHGNVPL